MKPTFGDLAGDKDMKNEKNQKKMAAAPSATAILPVGWR
jgi:hypothetical protein